MEKKYICDHAKICNRDCHHHDAHSFIGACEHQCPFLRDVKVKCVLLIEEPEESEKVEKVEKNMKKVICKLAKECTSFKGCEHQIPHDEDENCGDSCSFHGRMPCIPVEEMPEIFKPEQIIASLKAQLKKVQEDEKQISAELQKLLLRKKQNELDFHHLSNSLSNLESYFNEANEVNEAKKD